LTLTRNGPTAETMAGPTGTDSIVSEAGVLSVTIIPDGDDPAVELSGQIAAARRLADEIIAETVDAAEDLLSAAEARAAQIIARAETEAERILATARAAERALEEQYGAYREAFVTVAEAVGAMHVIAARGKVGPA